jgi:hypothetical protein
MAAQMKATGQAFWACRACSSYAAGMNHRLKEVGDQAKAALNKAEEAVKENNKLKDKVEKQSEKVDKKIAQTELDIYEEMSLREEKRKNVVIHGLPEPVGEDGWTRMEEDRKKLNSMFTVLDINVTVETDVEFCRRIGEKSERARPLVVGFYTEWAKSILLKNCKYLAETNLNNVSVVPDLTEKQRRAEKDLMAEADRRNKEDLTEQDVAKNLSWKVVGRRGQKRLVKVFDREQQQGAGRGRGTWRGRAGARGRGATSSSTGVGAPTLLPPQPARGQWQPTAGRGAATRGRAADLRKRRRSGEENQTRKRGAGAVGTRSRTYTMSQRTSSGGEEEVEEMEMSSQPSNLQQSSQPANRSPPREQQNAQQMSSEQGDRDSQEEEEEEMAALGGIRLGSD